jgi:hypothetical protein
MPFWSGAENAGATVPTSSMDIPFSLLIRMSYADHSRGDTGRWGPGRVDG